MAPLDTRTLPHEFPRRYVPAELDLGHWPSLEPLFGELEARALPSAADLEKWLSDLLELEEVLDEEGSARYVRMTC
ncbi:MAG TPA: M3 family oligoendopeptidase, partial [bacterium]|nr:M3 family oligoendopeptidase [bacterium]